MKLVFLYGPPAVGKYTIAKALARQLSLPLADNHALVNPLARIFGWGHPEQKRLADVFRLELFESAARADKSFITTFGGGGKHYDSFIQATLRAVQRHCGEVVFVHLVAPRATLLARVANPSRVKKFTIATEGRLREVLRDIPDVFAPALVGEHLEVDTSKYTAEAAARLIARTITD